tara:strand:- start:11851 stop:12000 length:150 start_codon:yes stop_codon:yes gene_type:complete
MFTALKNWLGIQRIQPSVIGGGQRKESKTTGGIDENAFTVFNLTSFQRL